MSAAHRALALVALAAAGLPLVAAGALAASGLESILALDQALALALALAGGIVALVWPLVALAPSVRGGGLRARALELGLLGAAFAPPLRLAALLARSADAVSARALVGLGALLVAQGAALAGLARTRLPRSVAVALAAALALGAPLAGFFAKDATGDDLGLARASLPAALLAPLGGGADPWPLAAALVALGALAALGARLRAAGRAPAAASALIALLVATPALAGDLEVDAEPAFLLGPRVHVGELAPIEVRVKASARGFEGELGVESGGLTVLAKLKLAGGQERLVLLPAVGGGNGMRIVVRPGGRVEDEERFEVAVGLRVLEPWETLVAVAPGAPVELKRALEPAPGRTGATFVEPGELLDAAASAGGALDVLVLGRGASPRLADFAALGGAIVLPDAPALEALGEGSGPRRDASRLARRGLGAGSLVAPLSSPALAVLSSSLALHAHVRRDPTQLANGFADAWPVPAPSARTAGRVALQTLLLVLVLAVVVLVPRSERRAALSLLLASLALTALVPLYVLGGARAPVSLDAALLLEAPSGGTKASCIEVLRLGSPRRITAEVDFPAGPPLVGVFHDERAAAGSHAEVHREVATGSLEPTAQRLRAPLEPGVPSAFARRSVRELGGAVTVAREAVKNGLAVPLEDAVLLVGKDRVVPLGDIAKGEEKRVGAEPLLLDEWLREARARPGRSERDRKRLALLQAALRGPASALRFAAFVPAPTAPRTLAGVLEEGTGEALLFVTER